MEDSERDPSALLRKVNRHILDKEEAAVGGYAMLSTATAGRPRETPASSTENRTAFAKDRDKILYCPTFIKLAGKTQVFLSPRNPLISNRLTHTMMVAQLARTVARAIDANEDLAEAIALGHDLGHPPFGHQGESVLNQLCADIGGFSHNVQSLHMVDVVENGGRGLNLTHEVREGILKHNGEVPTKEVRPSGPHDGPLPGLSPEETNMPPSTLEGCITRVCDRVAYMGKDIEDAIEAGIIARSDIPENLRRVLGGTNSEMIDTLIKELIVNFVTDRDNFTEENGREPGVREVALRLSPGVGEAMNELIGGVGPDGNPFGFNYRRIYLSEANTRYERHAETIMRALFGHFVTEVDGASMSSQQTLESWAQSKGITKDIGHNGKGILQVAGMLKGGATVADFEAFWGEYSLRDDLDDRNEVGKAVDQAILRVVRDHCKALPPEVGMSSIYTFLDIMTDEYVIGTSTLEKVRDYITTLTDEMAIVIFKKLFVPQPIV